MTQLKLGARWPDYSPETPIDRGSIRSFVEAVDELGFDHITAFDHRIGMTSEVAQREWGWTTERKWHEVFTLLSYMGAFTERLGFITAICVLPLRDPILVAKQAATVDVLTGGRFRLGVALGYEPEYRALHSEFEHRGTRMEEQIAIIRKLWENDSAEFHGRWYDFPLIGLSSQPIQSSLPIWLGMNREPPPWVLRRAGRIADGILPVWPPDEIAHGHLEEMRNAALNAGRNPSDIGIESAINLRKGREHNWVTTQKKSDSELADEITAWSELGATHLEFKSRSCGLTTLDEHLAEMTRFKEIADSVG